MKVKDPHGSEVFDYGKLARDKLLRPFIILLIIIFIALSCSGRGGDNQGVVGGVIGTIRDLTVPTEENDYDNNNGCPPGVVSALGCDKYPKRNPCEVMISDLCPH
jgi:hypothetical protein